MIIVWWLVVVLFVVIVVLRFACYVVWWLLWLFLLVVGFGVTCGLITFCCIVDVVGGFLGLGCVGVLYGLFGYVCGCFLFAVVKLLRVCLRSIDFFLLSYYDLLA